MKYTKVVWGNQENKGHSHRNTPHLFSSARLFHYHLHTLLANSDNGHLTLSE